jgi:hypothetical protein
MERYGTNGQIELTEQGMREALLALRAVVDRIGVAGFDVPFRDFGTFRSWWLRSNAYGSWQARRDLLNGIFDSLHDELARLESARLPGPSSIRSVRTRGPAGPRSIPRSASFAGTSRARGARRTTGASASIASP